MASIPQTENERVPATTTAVVAALVSLLVAISIFL